VSTEEPWHQPNRPLALIEGAQCILLSSPAGFCQSHLIINLEIKKPMKTKILIASLVLSAACAGSLFATPESDGKILDMANNAYDITGLQKHINVSVFNGVITLTGFVPNDAYKEVADDYARSLPGVSQVIDKVVIDPATPEPPLPERSDAWIASKVRMQLLMRVGVSSTSTTVAVKNGYVTLGGTAKSVAQKELTSGYAKDVLGVKVVSNNMVVKSAVAGAPAPAVAVSPGVAVSPAVAVAPSTEEPLVIETIDDNSVSTHIRYILVNSVPTQSLTPRVITQNGVVTITGEVTSDDQKAYVTRIAESVRGVKSVINNMTIAPTAAVAEIRPAPPPASN
jgi:osmotically-inducible protein OsmY